MALEHPHISGAHPLLIKEEVPMFKSLLARAREVRAAELEGEESLEGGFTLIELMVVLLIIAILLAIAIPTFLGVTGSAKDRAAQSTLTNVMTETVATYQNAQAFPSTSPLTNYSATDPQFSWVDGSTNATPCTVATAPKCVSVMPVDVATSADLQGVVIAVMSQTGTCWYAVNMQANPAGAAFSPADTSQFSVKSTSPASPAGQTAGTFYAKSATPAPAGSCWAGNYISGKSWNNSYGTAPAN
jgi:type IV pilus assembly protein PilA